LHGAAGFVAVQATAPKAAFGRKAEKLPETVGDVGFVAVVEPQCGSGQDSIGNPPNTSQPT
jgi:hypothetical protein